MCQAEPQASVANVYLESVRHAIAGADVFSAKHYRGYKNDDITK
jgi:hypothetical protein